MAYTIFTTAIKSSAVCLIENMVQGGQIKNSIIGIGLNINQESYPPHLPDVRFVKQILHQDYDLKIFIIRDLQLYRSVVFKIKGR